MLVVSVFDVINDVIIKVLKINRISMEFHNKIKNYRKILPEMMWAIITMREVIAMYLIIYNIFTHTVCATIYNR